MTSLPVDKNRATRAANTAVAGSRAHRVNAFSVGSTTRNRILLSGVHQSIALGEAGSRRGVNRRREPRYARNFQRWNALHVHPTGALCRHHLRTSNTALAGNDFPQPARLPTMPSSNLFSFFAGRLSASRLSLSGEVAPARYRATRLVVVELFAWSLVVLSTAALVWFVAPLVVSALHVLSPTMAIQLDLSLPDGFSSAQANWFVIKRVMVGYVALCLTCVAVFACWFVAAHRFGSESGKYLPRWSVVLDESGPD